LCCYSWAHQCKSSSSALVFRSFLIVVVVDFSLSY
jgi:hypothetical protein